MFDYIVHNIDHHLTMMITNDTTAAKCFPYSTTFHRVFGRRRGACRSCGVHGVYVVLYVHIHDSDVYAKASACKR